MDRNALAELLQALESRRDAEERRREERYTALIERTRSVDQAKFRTGLDDKEVTLKIIDDMKEDVLTFANNSLMKYNQEKIIETCFL
ncbi:UNVERIFIED_CONTAM: hypothetical protein FKN15_048306 [Acipenser sinensis]